MSDKKIESKGVSRRGFIKGAAVVAGSGLMAGATPIVAETQKGNGESSSGSRVSGYCGEGDWLGSPPVIPDAKVTKTIDVDVLVLGGGHAGLLAALGASDMGAKVAVIEKKAEKAFDDYFGRVGEDIGHVNSKWLINRGYGPYDTGEIVAEFVKRAAGRCNPDIIRLYVENSGAMFDRLVAVYEEYKELRKKNDSAVEFKYNFSGGMPAGDRGGAPAGDRSGAPAGDRSGAPAGDRGGMFGGTGNVVTETYDFSNIMSEKYLYNQVQKDLAPEEYPIELGGYKTWPCNAMFQGPVLRRAVSGMVSVLRWFQKYHVKKTIDQGVDWYYEASPVVLIQDAGGAVTGAVVQDKDEKYIRFNARKGVIVATGGFINNPEMCWALLNECMEWAERSGATKDRLGMQGVRDGYGHKLCCWAGGTIEPTPRGFMNLGGGAAGPWGVGPMLQINANAKRFCNEAAAPLTWQVAVRQPIGIMCVVTDRKYLQSILIAGLEHGGPNFGRSEWLEDMEEDMAKVLGAGAEGYGVRGLTVSERNPGTVYGANSLAELAGFLGYKGDLVETFVESIKHYNELCHAGVDGDFGKDAKAMIPIDEPPYYGCKGQNGGSIRPFMVTLSGLMTDANLQVLNKEGAPIKGLLVAGNTVGGRYGLGYSTPIAGNSIGMAMTHGWLAGKFAAAM